MREQERARKNLEAVGASSPQGKAFLDKLLRLENELDALKAESVSAAENVKSAEEAFAAFVQGLKAE